MIVFLAVSVVVFIMVRLTGVNPLVSILKGKATEQVIAVTRVKYFLDRPLLEQYFIWIGSLLTGNFGISYKYLQPVSTLIGNRLAVTFGLIIFSMIIMLASAIPIGVFSAVNRNTWIDRSISVLALIFLSVPAFFTSILFILLIAAFAPSISFTGGVGGFGDAVQRMLFPSVALALSMIAVVARITRSSMIDQLQSDHILNARAKGLSPGKIVFTHAFKNAMIPVLTVVGIQIGALMSGTVLVENVFALPGIGSLLIEGIKAGDYPVVEALTLLFVAVFLICNFIVDLSYAVVDPRIRLE